MLNAGFYRLFKDVASASNGAVQRGFRIFATGHRRCNMNDSKDIYNKSQNG